ncbi:hypothetical protein [Streptomyces sp. NPDC060035]|uniref:hypothetical protein n=1 Tax=Streptomyces sp. NPDC060035 TaxID=3347044 RepID=UPI0036B1F4E8
MSGRAASLPSAGYRRPERVSADGLVVHVVGQGGQDLGSYDFRACPGPEGFRRELAAGFARASVFWNSARTCGTEARTLRQFLRFAAEIDSPVARVSQLSAGVWWQWLLPCRRRLRLRSVLRHVDGLPAETRSAIDRPIARPASRPQQSYSRAEFMMIRAAATRAVRAAEIRIAEGVDLLQRWRAGELDEGSTEWQWGRLLDHVSRTGDVARYTVVGTSGARRLSRPVRGLLGEAGTMGCFALLYPTYLEMAAAAVLLICHEGWNLSVLATMHVPEQWPNADGDSAAPVVHRVETDKARRGPRLRHGSNNLVDLGEGTAGRAMRQVLQITAEARATLSNDGPPERRLLFARRTKATPGGDRFADGASLEHAVNHWSRTVGLVSQGQPLHVSAKRLRRTVQVLSGGPRHNTVRTHEDVYLLRDAQVREESGAVVADAQLEAVEYARARLRMRVVAAEAGADAVDAGRVARDAGISPETAGQVAAGTLDTAVAACLDFEHSPFTAIGPCAVSFLLCFACPNALATGHHLPRIAYLHQALGAVRSAVDAATWRADWADHHTRVGDLLREHTSEHALPVLLGRLTDRDRELIDHMLERRLDP